MMTVLAWDLCTPARAFSFSGTSKDSYDRTIRSLGKQAKVFSKTSREGRVGNWEKV